MSQLTKPQKRLTILASILGIIQAIAWITMAVICVVEYLFTDSFTPPNTSDSHMSKVQYWIIMVFLNSKSDSNTTINPQSFSIFMWLYIIVDLIWLGLSIALLYWMNKTGYTILTVMKNWGVMTVLLSFIDLLLVILIGVSFGEVCVPESTFNAQNVGVACSEIFIPVLVIAARGFTLWIVNVSCVYCIYRIIRTVQSGKNLNYKLRLVDPQIPRATLQKPSKNPSMSENYDDWWKNGQNGQRPSSYIDKTVSLY